MLTDLACKKAAAKGAPYRISDTLGLDLYVTASGHRSWRMGYWFAKVKKRLVLGTYPEPQVMAWQLAPFGNDAA